MEDDEVDVSDGQPLLSQEKKEREGKRGVNALQLTMMIYFFTSGGPFGIETAVGAGGPLITLICLFVIPLVWSLPQALLSAELSLMVNVNGGNVVWVQRAFGDFIGWINAFNCIACSFVSMSQLVVLFVEYIPIEFTLWQSWLIKIGFVTFITVLNILGLRWISRLSILFIIFIISPFVAQIVLFFSENYYTHFDPHQYLFVPPFKQIDWALLLSTVIWSYGGFDSMGSLAGEVKGGRPTFMRGIIGSMPLIMVNYYFPVLVGFAILSDWTKWTSGYFTNIAYLLHNWLGVWTVAASALSNFGQYNAAMAPLARVVWSMARDKDGVQKLPGLLAWSWRRHTGTIRPIAAIVFTGLMSALLCALPFNLLVKMFLILRIVNLVCEYASLIKLRYSEPDTPRPFVVPGGMVMAWLLGLPTVIISIFTLCFTDWEVWVFGITVNVLILISYAVRLLIVRCLDGRKKTEGLLN